MLLIDIAQQREPYKTEFIVERVFIEVGSQFQVVTQILYLSTVYLSIYMHIYIYIYIIKRQTLSCKLNSSFIYPD